MTGVDEAVLERAADVRARLGSLWVQQGTREQTHLTRPLVLSLPVVVFCWGRRSKVRGQRSRVLVRISVVEKMHRMMVFGFNIFYSKE